jgi:uncharacterized membrane protein
MARYLIGFLAVAAVMAALDMLWLRLTVKALYAPAIGPLLSEHTNGAAATLFYVLYVFAIMIFATGPALRGGGLSNAIAMGAAFGFFAYMTYDLTNMATLKVWPAHLAAIDIAWGTVLTALAASGGYAAGSLLA